MTELNYLITSGLKEIKAQKSADEFFKFLTERVDIDTGDTRLHEIAKHNHLEQGLLNIAWEPLSAEQMSEGALRPNYYGNMVLDYMQNPQLTSGRMQAFTDILLAKENGPAILEHITTTYCHTHTSSSPSDSDAIILQNAWKTRNFTLKLDLLSSRTAGVSRAADMAKQLVGAPVAPSFYTRANVQPDVPMR